MGGLNSFFVDKSNLVNMSMGGVVVSDLMQSTLSQIVIDSKVDFFVWLKQEFDVQIIH